MEVNSQKSIGMLPSENDPVTLTSEFVTLKT